MPHDPEESRYSVFERRNGEPVEIAATSMDGIGLTLCTLADDRREAGLPVPVLGVLDTLEHRWIAGLWHGRDA